LTVLVELLTVLRTREQLIWRRK